MRRRHGAAGCALSLGGEDASLHAYVGRHRRRSDARPACPPAVADARHRPGSCGEDREECHRLRGDRMTVLLSDERRLALLAFEISTSSLPDPFSPPQDPKPAPPSRMLVSVSYNSLREASRELYEYKALLMLREWDTIISDPLPDDQRLQHQWDDILRRRLTDWDL